MPRCIYCIHALRCSNHITLSSLYLYPITSLSHISTCIQSHHSLISLPASNHTTLSYLYLHLITPLSHISTCIQSHHSLISLPVSNHITLSYLYLYPITSLSHISTCIQSHHSLISLPVSNHITLSYLYLYLHVVSHSHILPLFNLTVFSPNTPFALSKSEWIGYFCLFFYYSRAHCTNLSGPVRCTYTFQKSTEYEKRHGADAVTFDDSGELG